MTPSRDILALGLGLEEPWKIVDQWLDTDKSPNELHIRISAAGIRGRTYISLSNISKYLQ
jgi:hypothetical protein